MKIRTKLFNLTNTLDDNAPYKSINPTGDEIIILNGEPTETKVSELFTDMELDENEIYGNSLLSFYSVQDGKLVVDGSTIEFAMPGTHERILIDSITRPGVNDDTVIPFEHIQKFSEFFKVAKPDEVFIGLNEEEKQVFIDQRNNLSASKQKALEAAATAETESKAKEAEEKKLKASIDPKLVHNKKSYLSQQAFYRSIDFKEHITGAYHLFYGGSEDEMPFVLIKRGIDWWQEPTDIQISDINDKTVEVDFNDDQVYKMIRLDIASGEITVLDQKVSE